jgi:type I restriction enzyme M protein
LFYATPIPVCLWFLSRNKADPRFRDRRKETLFIDARKMGVLIDRVHRELTEAEVERITRTYHAWRGEKEAGKYEDISGFCKSATLAEIKEHNYVLTPGRYVGAEDTGDDGEAFDDKMQRLTTLLSEQMKQSQEMDAEIRTQLAKVGYGG